MSHNTLPTVAELSGEMRERLAKVKYVFTDLDATMLEADGVLDVRRVWMNGKEVFTGGKKHD